jgi:two-component system, chemotaxis family, protein-glutamate methylesterase/glutaminase
MIRCLVADDSRAFRAILRTILSRGPGLEVVGEAADGAEAVRQTLALRPDVVTMDVRMPGKDGLTAIDEIMTVAPTPIVVVSAEAGPEKQELAFRALQAGAVEVLAKPRADVPGRFEREADAIRSAVRAVAGLPVGDRRRRRPSSPGPAAVRPPPPATTAAPRAAVYVPLPPAAPRVIGIVASTGGPAALARIVRELPASFPIPLLVVQHIAQGFESGLVHWLAGETGLRVKLAEDREAPRGGVVHIAPGGAHLGLGGGLLRLLPGEPVRGFRPSGTTLLEHLAREYGSGAAGLVLSGMGDDGADGLKALRDRGGWTAAQGPQSSVIYGMPRVALERGAAGAVLELEEIAGALLRVARVAT